MYTKHKLSARAGLVALFTLTCAVTPSAAASYHFEQQTSLSIPASGPASVFPWSIVVGGVPDGPMVITTTLSGFSHTYPNDVAAVLMGPGDVIVRLFDGPGGHSSAVNLVWQFADRASIQLPSDGPLTSGLYKPGQDEYSTVFEGLLGIYESSFSRFSGHPANGIWKLYVQDFAEGDSGNITAWSIDFQSVPEPSSAVFVLLGIAGLVAASHRL